MNNMHGQMGLFKFQSTIINQPPSGLIESLRNTLLPVRLANISQLTSEECL